MLVKFTKMHGAGNDYIYFDCTKREFSDPEKAAVKLSDRHFGIGGDGIVLICSSDVADFKMRMFNSDGSEGKICGNALICIGKYVHDNELTDKTELTIETLAGIKKLTLSCFVKGGPVDNVTVEMGKAILEPENIPIIAEKHIRIPIVMPDGKIFHGTAVSMGNPHMVFFMKPNEYPDFPEFEQFETYGRFIENNEIFPDRTNVEFIKVRDEKNISMRVWERGAGETLACGSGTCASVVAAVLNGFCIYGVEVCVNVKGGKLYVTYNDDGSVIMRGKGTTVFTGTMRMVY
jgi:diaminopimelate epimerase